MEHPEKIYEQFRNAAKKSEQKGYPDMEKVWSRVEDKLDRQMLTNENQLWKKIAVAASVILVATLVFVVSGPDKQSQTIITKVPETATPIVEEAVIVEQAAPSEIKPEAAEILDQKITQQQSVVVQKEPDFPQDIELKEHIVTEQAVVETAVEKRSARAKFVQQRTVAVGVRSAEFEVQPAQVVDQAKPKKRPLLVVDGKAIRNDGSAKYRRLLAQAMAEPKNGSEVLYMQQPLYIINGVSYTEEELFGDDSTNPYAPLDEQYIETIAILQGEQATAIYGDRGSKGVMIITIKNNKPPGAE